MARWREQPSRPGKKGPRPVAARAASPPPTVHTYSPRRASWHLLHDEADLTEHERAYIAHLLQACPTIARLQALALAFRELVHQHDLAAFAKWFEEADAADIPELIGFANGLRADRAAVEAGITLPWSQGQTEGQVNRLKTLKRAMYGRGKLDLLKLGCSAPPEWANSGAAKVPVSPLQGIELKHLRSVLTEFVEYYNVERPHRASAEGSVRSRPVLGGLHHVYERAA